MAQSFRSLYVSCTVILRCSVHSLGSMLICRVYERWEWSRGCSFVGYRIRCVCAAMSAFGHSTAALLYSIARALDSDPSCFHAAVLWLALTSSGAQVNTLRLIG